MLGVMMKKVFFTLLFFLLLWGCSWDSDDYQECYEPLFLNETKVDVSLFYGSIGDDEENLQSIVIKSGDTTYNQDGTFPFLHKEGLGSFESNLYDVRLEFHTTQKMCLTFKGKEFQKHDVRDFSSYENLGPCKYCSMRGQSEPDAMLYRINDDLLKRANSCK